MSEWRPFEPCLENVVAAKRRLVAMLRTPDDPSLAYKEGWRDGHFGYPVSNMGLQYMIGYQDGQAER